MKRLLAFTFLGVLFLGMALQPVKAYDFNTDSGLGAMGTSTELDKNGVTEPDVYIGQILTLLFSFLGIIFFILTIYAGINWMTAQGDSSQVTKAKETLIRAIVGLVIALAAYGITYFVMNIFSKSQPAPTFIDSPVNNQDPFAEPQA